MGLGARVTHRGNMKLGLPETHMDSRLTKGLNVTGRSGELCGHRKHPLPRAKKVLDCAVKLQKGKHLQMLPQ